MLQNEKEAKNTTQNTTATHTCKSLNLSTPDKFPLTLMFLGKDCLRFNLKMNIDLSQKNSNALEHHSVDCSMKSITI